MSKKEIVNKMIKHVETTKPKDLCKVQLNWLACGEYSKFIKYVYITFTQGVLVDLCDELIKLLDEEELENEKTKSN